MTTDTSERGLERLICTALTRAPCDRGVPPSVVQERPATHAASWVGGAAAGGGGRVTVPAQPKLYHIAHVGRVPSIVGARYLEDRCDLAQLGEIDWNAVQAMDWRRCARSTMCRSWFTNPMGRRQRTPCAIVVMSRR